MRSWSASANFALNGKIKCRYPADADGNLILHKLPDDQLKNYQGVIGHFHIQTNKVDPGPAMDWDRVIDGARALMPSERVSHPPAGKGW